MQDLNDLYYFTQVVEHGGFAPAARALGMQKSKLSRRLGLLEDRLGVRLIQRSSRSFSVTEIGQEYYRRCLAMLVEAEAAQAVIDSVRSEPQGVVRMSCPPSLLGYHFGELIARFMIDNPKVQIHLRALDRRVDVIAEGFDLAIRAGTPPQEQSDLVLRRLGETPQCLIGSPSLLKSHPTAKVPTDLSGLPSLDFGLPQDTHAWNLAHADGLTAVVHHEPRLVSDDLAAILAAALEGVGIVQVPVLMVEDDIKAGRLIDVLPSWRPRNGIVYAVFPSRRGLLPSIRALLDFLADECKDHRL
ncbi:MAG: LysR substrate-binding domain-containing protein [Reyranella sp.]|nr:LysR substrate-binding domain-containing protein [Reyranella sp.]MDP3160018.1 LysR substrate-binding domain-containing protein [Reyranella sp.]